MTAELPGEGFDDPGTQSRLGCICWHADAVWQKEALAAMTERSAARNDDGIP
jgi:hypothetical protein